MFCDEPYLVNILIASYEHHEQDERPFGSYSYAHPENFFEVSVKGRAPYDGDWIKRS
jgi:hypothetical protein